MNRLKFSRGAENGVFWMLILLGTLGFLSLFSAGRQAIQAGGGKMKALAEGRSHKTSDGLRPVCSVDNGRRQIALTFDVSGRGGELEGLLQVIEVLEESQAKASFFVSGQWAGENPEYIGLLAEKGHDIGSMGQRGTGMENLTMEQRQEEIRQAHEQIKELTGQEADLFRPAWGGYDDSLVTAVCAMGYYPIWQDVDSEDWKDYGAKAVGSQVLENEELKDGSIIRFRCGPKYTAEGLKGIIAGLQETGYELVPLSQMVIKERYGLDGRGRQRSEK